MLTAVKFKYHVWRSKHASGEKEYCRDILQAVDLAKPSYYDLECMLDAVKGANCHPAEVRAYLVYELQKRLNHHPTKALLDFMEIFD